MTVMTRLLAWLAAALLFSMATGQVPLGTVPPAPTWDRWLQGAPVELVDGKRPASTLFVFFTLPATPSLFAAEADYLADLQQRFAARGLVVVAVVGGPSPGPLEPWAPCRVVVDADRVTTAAWFADVEEAPRALLLDGDGRLVFAGDAACGLVDAVEIVLAGKARDLAGFAAAASLRAELLTNYVDLTAEAIPAVEQALLQVPHDGVLFGFLYLLHVCQGVDAGGGKPVLQRAVAALAGESRPLAAFADLALRGDPGRPSLLAALREPLQAASRRASHDPAVQLALLRLLVQAGEGRDVGRQAMRMRKVATGTVADCLDFATILAQDREPLVHRDLVASTVQRAEQLGAAGRFLVAARYALLRRCAGDLAGAKQLLEQYEQEKEDGSTLNNDCWYLMTEVPTMGRFGVFAIGLAERMLEKRDEMDAAEFDTAALAMFLGGRTTEAVELQQVAIQKGGNGNPDYEQRLARYRAAAATPAR